MPTPSADRIHVTSGTAQIGVVVVVGEVQVAITLPALKGATQLSAEQARATALRLARRALDVAREELAQEP